MGVHLGPTDASLLPLARGPNWSRPVKSSHSGNQNVSDALDTLKFVTLDQGRPEERAHAHSDVGRVVLICGPDGTGKSTLAESLVGALSSFNAVRRAHRSPPVLPRLNPGPVTDPHASAPYPRWISLLKLAYLFIDFDLAWRARVRPFVRSGGWLVIERGWWDLAVDPRRYRLRVSTRLIRYLGDRLPQPDLVLVLFASVEDVLARKAELPVGELTRQMRAWRVVLPAKLPVAYLDASRPASEVLAAALGAIRELER